MAELETEMRSFLVTVLAVAGGRPCERRAALPHQHEQYQPVALDGPAQYPTGHAAPTTPPTKTPATATPSPLVIGGSPWTTTQCIWAETILGPGPLPQLPTPIRWPPRWPPARL